MNDEKTTEIELPAHLNAKIVRVNFTERRRVTRPMGAPIFPPERRTQARTAVVSLDDQWRTPLWVRLAALGAIIILSLLVL